MDNLYQIFKLWHIISFVFMSIPLFNLIVVNERTMMGSSFNFGTDRYMENIIRHGAVRCYVFQLSVFISGILLLVYGQWGIQALWTNYIKNNNSFHVNGTAFVCAFCTSTEN